MATFSSSLRLVEIVVLLISASKFLVCFANRPITCTCTENGNIYTPDYDNCCEKFYQHTDPDNKNQFGVIPCPAGLIYDVNTCVCNWPYAATCSSSCNVVTATWRKQEKDIANYIKQDSLPELSALTLCFRFKPLVIGNTDAQGNKYVISISDPGKTKRWNLGVRTNPSLAFGLSPNSYFTDGVDNAEENDLWRQEHKHCFVWEENGPFKWFVDNDAGQPGQMVMFRTVDPNQVDTIQAGGTIIPLNEQDTLGGGLNANQIIPGWIAQLNLYDTAFDDSDITRMRMFCNDKGNVVNEDTITVVGTMDTDTEDFECLGC